MAMMYTPPGLVVSAYGNSRMNGALLLSTGAPATPLSNQCDPPYAETSPLVTVKVRFVYAS